MGKGTLSGLDGAYKAIEARGGLAYAVAAVSEGFCPSCTARLTDAAGVEVMDELYPTKPSAQGNCAPCGLLWSAGTGGWGDWLTMDDHHEGMLRRMSLNPGPSKDDEWDDEEEEWP